MFANKIKKSGFGVIEVLVASTIIIIVLAAVVEGGRSALINSIRTHQRAQALAFAEEGLEIARQVRDSHWQDGDNQTEWDYFSYDIGSSTWQSPASDKKYQVGYLSALKRPFFLELPTDGKEEITVDNTKFYRQVTFEPVANILPNSNPLASDLLQNQARRVTAIIETPWGSEVKLSEILTNWRPDY